jgi:hypothetical protein
MRAAIQVLLLGGAFALVGCVEERPRTQVMVVLDAEAGMRGVIAGLEVTVLGSTGRPGAVRTERFLQQFPGGAEGIGWPREIAVGPLDLDADRVFEIVATGYDASGVDIARTRAISGLHQHRRLA